MKVLTPFINTPTNAAVFIHHWGDITTAGGTNNECVIQDCVEWARYQAFYRYFKINGIKMEFHPIDISGSSDVIFQNLQVGTSPDGTNLSATSI